jgi:basic membrane lipoprotein Med (substrate-binding protein (PBP1-ABC) superfamily)
MKKLISMLLVLVMVLSLVGCGSKGTTNTDSKVTKKDPKDLKIALLVPSSPTDGGWGQLGAEAVKEIEKKYGCKVSVVEAGTADKMKSEAEALADEGYDIIFGHGGQYASPFGEICDNYPNTYFVTDGGNVVTKNLFPIVSTMERICYVQGVIAAKLTKTNKLGVVLGGDYPAFTKTSRGFEMGAKSVNPNITVMTTVLTTGDMNEAYESSMSQINSGADIIWSNANQATLGSAKAATEKNAYFFGNVSDMSKDAPTVTVASAVQDFSTTYVTIVDRFVAGSLKAEQQNLTLADGNYKFVWNDAVKSKLPADVQNIDKDLIPKVESGEIKVPGENEGW